jgi:uncharacterized protein (TIGR00369 family)
MERPFVSSPPVEAVTTASLKAEIDSSPFNAWLGLEVLALDAAAGTLVLAMPARPELMRLPGSDVFHGGPLAALADIAGDYAVRLRVGGGVPTVQLSVDYMKPCAGTQVRAEACVRRMGKSFGWVDIELRGSDGSLCVLARGHYLAKVG